MNCAAVLSAIRAAGTARVTELVQATSLSRPTVTAAVSTLMADGWVEETEAPDLDLPRMGRPARVLRFRADAWHVLGIDVGPHKIYCAVADLSGRVVAHARRDVTAASTHAELLDQVEATMRTALDQVPITAADVAAVGIGTPGIVDDRRGAVVQAPSVPGWSSLELASLFRRGLDCPVRVENDVNLAVMAERWNGTAGDAENLILVQWGARIGAAVLVDGQLHRGAHGAAGEIGFLELEEEPQGVQADGLGPLESAVGTAWILRRARSLGDDESSDAAAVLAAAAGGDPRALQAVDEACARLARGLASFVSAIDPELVVIGGSITLAGDVILAGLRRHLGSRTLVEPRLELSRLGDDAVALGAVRLALADAERRLLDVYATPLPVEHP
ncbi:ROK family transcriptional regulator [Jiangella aurantiaca]|uniref:ROK family transcriptional regulator n=1 Tax=Jiangella aurantiaca TaxID=2530373 RepID=A0A4R5AEW1_9ACTN|nr:ROK family transcriptional regulator [Jiangella aurantiaca]TDD71083.1 ROK family transcriptional regulator [Jiangella aurantiaca]